MSDVAELRDKAKAIIVAEPDLDDAPVLDALRALIDDDVVERALIDLVVTPARRAVARDAEVAALEALRRRRPHPVPSRSGRPGAPEARRPRIDPRILALREVAHVRIPVGGRRVPIGEVTLAEWIARRDMLARRARGIAKRIHFCDLAIGVLRDNDADRLAELL